MAPACNAIKSPLGVNTCTSLSWRLIFISSSNSSAFSLLLSRISRNSFSQFSIIESEDPPLYFQWAANPFSAISSIRSVRICTSTQRLPGPSTVVCNDSYPLDLGTEIQSRRRWGLGVYLSVTIEYTRQQSGFSFSPTLSIMKRTAKMSKISSNSTWLFRILFKIEAIVFVRYFILNLIPLRFISSAIGEINSAM